MSTQSATRAQLMQLLLLGAEELLRLRVRQFLTFPFGGATTVLMPDRSEAGVVLDVVERYCLSYLHSPSRGLGEDSRGR